MSSTNDIHDIFDVQRLQLYQGYVDRQHFYFLSFATYSACVNTRCLLSVVGWLAQYCLLVE